MKSAPKCHTPLVKKVHVIVQSNLSLCLERSSEKIRTYQNINL